MGNFHTNHLRIIEKQQEEMQTTIREQSEIIKQQQKIMEALKIINISLLPEEERTNVLLQITNKVKDL